MVSFANHTYSTVMYVITMCMVVMYIRIVLCQLSEGVPNTVYL